MGAQVLTVPKISPKCNLLNVDVCDAILLEGEIDNRKNLLNCNIKLLTIRFLPSGGLTNGPFVNVDTTCPPCHSERQTI